MTESELSEGISTLKQILAHRPPKKKHFRRITLDVKRNCPFFFDILLEYVSKNEEQ